MTQNPKNVSNSAVMEEDFTQNAMMETMKMAMDVLEIVKYSLNINAQEALLRVETNAIMRNQNK